ncbi:MAG: M1 family metallopeptidase [Phycisphaeraceae bacterium]|nr:M1 family metallopeptidase [Phycisphaeraceae bacterium]
MILRHRASHLVSVLIALVVCIGFAGAQPDLRSDPRIDPRTGQDLRVWAPARHFDYQHMKLEITIPDMNIPKFHAIQTLRARAVGKDRAEMRLDAQGPVINAISSGGRSLAFTHERRELLIYFPAPVRAGTEIEITIDYDLDYSRSTPFTGLFWSAGRPGDPEINNHWPQMHTQGQPESNNRWFPCHDYPNDRLSTEILVDVEDGYQVLSNGRLISGKGQGPDRAGPGRVRWHWLQESPHVAYLVTLVVGKFAIVEIGGPDSARPGLPMRAWGPLGKERELRELFKYTPEMVAAFERYLGREYPWDKYDQVAARNYVGGAMENTSASTFFGTIASVPPETQQGIIAHELIHQWMGNLLTCRGWAHIWLNEGWASMGQALWDEEYARLQGRDPREAYLAAISQFLGQQRSNRGTAPRQPALVSNLYRNPLDVFMKQDNPYPKGALVLHMLREMLGEEVFFEGVRLFVRRHQFQEVETSDFRRCLEEVSGRSLERFFEQWCMRPGLPQLTVEIDWVADDMSLVIVLRQTQTINAYNPAYAFELPIHIEYADGRSEVRSIFMDTRESVTRWGLSAPPKDVIVNPDLTVACRPRINKSLSMWRHQLEHGPTIPARIEAVEYLASLRDARLDDLLELTLNDDSLHPAVRSAAADALADRAIAWIP